MSGWALPFGLGVFDALCLLIVLVSCLVGCWRGFVFEVLSLAAWAGAFFAAQWGTVLAKPLWPAHWLADARARFVLTFAVVFIATLFVLGWCAAGARRGLKKTGLRPFDRVLGMGFGLLRAVLLLWAMTVVIWLTPLHKEAWWKQGQAAPWLDTSLRWAAPLLPATFQEWLPPALRARPSV